MTKEGKRLGIDVLGNIVILKFDRDVNVAEKKKIAEKFLKEHKQVSTVLEKAGKFSGRLRTQKTKWLAGEKTKEALYRENACTFRFNVDTCYFSPRLSEERKEISSIVKKGEEVLVMFGGVGVYGIIIAKNSKASRVVSIELGRECSKYALFNVKRNKLQERVQIIQGDVRRKLPDMKEQFDRIVMARPQLKDSFLDVALPLIRKGGIIHYYGFYEEDDLEKLKELVKEETKKARRKIRILRIKKAGDIGFKKFRYRVDMKIS